MNLITSNMLTVIIGISMCCPHNWYFNVLPTQLAFQCVAHTIGISMCCPHTIEESL